MRRALFVALLALFLLHHGAAPAAAQAGGGGAAAPPRWNTLSGNRPVVIAKGGFSGLFPDSSSFAYRFAPPISLPDVVLWCDVQLTRDEVGLCLPDINMDNCTDIRNWESPVIRNRTYTVNGQPLTAWFASDYNLTQLSNITLVQGIFSRPYQFDAASSINTVDYFRTFNTQSIWLNIQHELFYRQQNLNMTRYLISVSAKTKIGYISSPEVNFLRSVAPIFANASTKLVFRFLGKELIDPSTNQSYALILKNLTFVKTFASGILIPKDYIWQSTASVYLVQQPTTIVSDARKAGLEVFVSDFQNDIVIPFNYSYNPVAEYLNFINLGNISVDGFLSDFPTSASEAIGCFAHGNSTTPINGKPTIIAHNGDSGDYPGCTDLAYKKAVDVGADYIECPVRFTKDGILICLGSVDLMSTTNIATSAFGTRFSTIPDIQSTLGIFTFNLTWPEIQSSLRPAILNPQYEVYKLLRNPAHKNDGSFMSLDDFLKFALNSSSISSLKGVVITIEHAAFLTGKLGFNVTDTVISALNAAGFDKQTRLEVMIQSTNSSALLPFKKQTKYKILYKVAEVISDVDNETLTYIKSFSDAVAVRKQSIFPTTIAFITNQTNLVERLHSVNLPVYSYLLMNEFITPPWDFFADPIVEIHNHVAGASVDGVITDFPETASLYRRETCSLENYTIPLVQPGGLIEAINSVNPANLPPALPAFPTLKNVTEPSLPPALRPIAPPPADNGGNGSPAVNSGQPSILPSFIVLTMSLALFLVAPQILYF